MSQPDGCPPPGCPAVLIEAFTDRAGAGNGAAVVLLAQPADDGWMQTIAASLRQSETAFLLPVSGTDTWLLRWFTPSQEVPLCGHATLGALLALGHWGEIGAGQALRFRTRSGALPVRLLEPGRGQLDLPCGSMEPAPVPDELGSLLLRTLGQRPEAYWTSRLGYGVALVPPGAPLASMAGLAHELQGPARQGLVLMQAVGGPSSPRLDSPRLDNEAADYQLRFFAPGLGIDEDPVTGSAHALVAPYWQERLKRSRVIGWQCSDRPGGMVCESASSGMIRLSGTGHLLWDGILNASAPPWPEGSSPEQEGWHPPAGLEPKPSSRAHPTPVGDDGERAWRQWLACDGSLTP